VIASGQPQHLFFFIHKFDMATTEDLQTLVLTTLDKVNSISDSKDLTYNDAPVDQLALLGALNSLKSKDVLSLKSSDYIITHIFL
jgi:hypothetical protein